MQFMFVVMLTYKKPLEFVEQHVEEHRTFLDVGYKDNFLIVSGPQKPRIGGIILSQLNDREQLENFMKNDPFYIHGIADYEFIKFDPVKCHPDFSSFIK
jgi:uncharacterized protein YciI